MKDWPGSKLCIESTLSQALKYISEGDPQNVISINEMQEKQRKIHFERYDGYDPFTRIEYLDGREIHYRNNKEYNGIDLFTYFTIENGKIIHYRQK